MRTLFSLDTKDYPPDGRVFVRDSARSILIRQGRVAMVHSLQYDYYKFPGGGIEPGESPVDAMIRETREEAGLTVRRASIREFGCVRRVQASDRPDAEIFRQDNYYYLCQAEETPVPQQLDDYEAQEHFTLDWVDPRTAIAVNRGVPHGPKDQVMLEREARVLELLEQEGYFSAS